MPTSNRATISKAYVDARGEVKRAALGEINGTEVDRPPPDGADAASYYSTLTVVKLQVLLRSKGLKVSGKKANLIERLVSSKSTSAKPTKVVSRTTTVYRDNSIIQRKRKLKQQLKIYDMNFHAQHGRMPEKREKEPIRHLYESYNAYKNQITVIEKGEAQPGPGTAAFRGVPDSPPAAAADAVAPPVSVPPTHQDSEHASSPGQASLARIPSGGSEKTEMNDYQEEADGPIPEVSSHDLASLKAEKATLHQALRLYEKDFFRQHRRQVSSFADIRPVASQYRRYKEIKKAIAQISSG